LKGLFFYFKTNQFIPSNLQPTKRINTLAAPENALATLPIAHAVPSIAHAVPSIAHAALVITLAALANALAVPCLILKLLDSKLGKN
jgi:hypothetical protein